MNRKHCVVGLTMGLAFFAGCSRAKTPLPPEPPIVETIATPRPIIPTPAPTTTLPGPIAPPPEVLQVQHDGR